MAALQAANAHLIDDLPATLGPSDRCPVCGESWIDVETYECASCRETICDGCVQMDERGRWYCKHCDQEIRDGLAELYGAGISDDDDVTELEEAVRREVIRRHRPTRVSVGRWQVDKAIELGRYAAEAVAEIERLTAAGSYAGAAGLGRGALATIASNLRIYMGEYDEAGREESAAVTALR